MGCAQDVVAVDPTKRISSFKRVVLRFLMFHYRDFFCNELLFFESVAFVAATYEGPTNKAKPMGSQLLRVTLVDLDTGYN